MGLPLKKANKDAVHYNSTKAQLCADRGTCIVEQSCVRAAGNELFGEHDENGNLVGFVGDAIRAVLRREYRPAERGSVGARPASASTGEAR